MEKEDSVTIVCIVSICCMFCFISFISIKSKPLLIEKCYQQNGVPIVDYDEFGNVRKVRCELER